jgi:hypothetical protein
MPAGPRELVVTVYALEMGSLREIMWRVQIERTPTRARRAARQLVAEVCQELGPGVERRSSCKGAIWIRCRCEMKLYIGLGAYRPGYQSSSEIR